jgi:hypothetical protein
MNALKHGLDAQTLILPGEDEAAFRDRLDAWRADFPPRNSAEETLLEQIARFSWQLDRAYQALNTLLAERVALADSAEAGREADAEAVAEADRIGRLLVAGPYATVFTVRGDDEVPVRRWVGTPIHPDDPAHPGRLLRHLESTAAGCRWLLDSWATLRAALEGGDACWQPAQRLAAVHLLGKQPVDAVDDPLVQCIYLCSFVLAPHGPSVFADQAGTMTTAEFEYFLDRLAGRRVSKEMPPDRESAREWLLAIVDAVIAGLEVRSAGHAARGEQEAASEYARLAFDDSPEDRRLRRLQQRLLGSLLRTVDLLMKARSQPAVQAAHPEPSQNVAASPGASELCKKLRNEPNASTSGEKPAKGSPAEECSVCCHSGDAPEPTPGADPAQTLDGTPEATTACEEIRNEPNAAIEGARFPWDDEDQRGSSRISLPIPGNDSCNTGEPGQPSGTRGRSGPPSRAGPRGAG